jgi:uncharacterized protein YaiL (DUF2058 family)
MGNSLQDQLLKAGLVDSQKAKQVATKKRKKAKGQHKGRGSGSDPGALQVRQEQAAKVERDRRLNRQREQIAQRKAVAAQVRQLIEAHRVPRGEGDLPYNFLDDKAVKRIYVTPDIQRQLCKGKLAIAKLGGRYELVPHDVAEQIRKRDETSVIPAPEEQREQDQDDFYSDYKVPDELSW